MTNATKTIIIPTNPADLKKLKGFVQEGCDCLLRIDSEKDQLKSIIETAVEEFELPKATISALIRHQHRADFEKKEVEFEDFSALWDAVQNA
jgi:hypothetical protein